MAGKSGARGSSSTTSRSRSGARGSSGASGASRAKGSTRKPATTTRRQPAARRPARSTAGPRRKAPSRSSRPVVLQTLGRGIGTGWTMIARGVGATTRTVGRVTEVEHGHRRDGIALGLIAASVVVAGSVWFAVGGPLGGWIEAAVRALVGGASAVLPLTGLVIAVVLMRTEPRPEIRPRLVLGSILVALPALGLWHIASGMPTDGAGRAGGAGFLGYLVGGPLTDGLTVWLSVPLLLMAAGFGILLLTGTTIRELP
ncbi:MAG: cell division protein FtsK, partial [Rhodococcus sp. (in: high G+C Gram-positive bacteria)]|nr:cell division protein FtsK [Rhodococcus sp. (in: high G+C Gram-positive bacteria)]MDX5452255.1 cell division protein FtsK [Rhodococcus sp. (in: high G+C Gram-positive bacteria)]